MPRNFLIGIGGTGARCVEAVLHLCAAGLGPEDLWVGFIDQDADNGNLTDAKDLLRALGTLQAKLEGNDHQATGLPLLCTQLWAGVVPAALIDNETPYVWHPTPND